MMWTTTAFLFCLLCLALSGCDGAGVGEQGSYQDDSKFGPKWMSLIQDARAEGEVVILLSASRSRDHRPVFDAFTRKYGVRVVAGSGSSTSNAQRVLVERSKGRYTTDVALISGRTADWLRKSDALVRLEPMFVHPEVVDRSHGWAYHRQLWLDAEGGYVAAYKLYVRENITDIYYNSDQVSEEEIGSILSWWDLLDPKWKGRIVAVMDPNDPTDTAHIRTPWVVLGREWFERFLREQQPVLLPVSSMRELSDGVAHGKYHVSLFGASAAERDMDKMFDQGIPVRKLRRTLKEGGSVTLGGGIAMLDRAPHPSAAKLFVNWYLSRDGQNTCQTMVDSADPSPSLRSDVEQGLVSDYAWGIVRNLDEYSVVEPDPELDFEVNAASAAFVREICAELSCYGQ